MKKYYISLKNGEKLKVETDENLESLFERRVNKRMSVTKVTSNYGMLDPARAFNRNKIVIDLSDISYIQKA